MARFTHEVGSWYWGREGKILPTAISVPKYYLFFFALDNWLRPKSRAFTKHFFLAATQTVYQLCLLRYNRRVSLLFCILFLPSGPSACMNSSSWVRQFRFELAEDLPLPHILILHARPVLAIEGYTGMYQ
jgi:hypothetical protein